ncbi:acetoacetate--CoA ligase [Hydrogenophaga sp.]|uniref:acetoacetate--CoA ligase n=1 Tax=Hydrogenophaga sp. TaxID=1904254 RepID=UPI00260BB25E|nr:acetoacetate--CoA ligase [Hydrogenophaga sp.]MCW5652125.1 acetoacetate--CoA ligase [Hydrogenophaga sp.]
MKANTQGFREWVNARHGLTLSDYDALWRWSVADVGVFWQAIWDYFDIQSPSPARQALASVAMPGARWFEGAQLNYRTQVFRHAEAAQSSDVPAIVFRNERLQREGRSLEISWDELERQVSALAGALQAMGVQRGDRVAAYLPNIPQAAIGLLACASLGAIWSLCATDMGVATVRDRFRQIEPKVLIGCDGTVYGGKVAERVGLLEELLGELPSVQHLVLVPYLAQAGAAPAQPVPARWPGQRHAWADCLAHAPLTEVEPVPFDHPLWIVYSSGTTGMPKPIVHGHGGVVLEMLKLHHLHLNLGPSAETGDRFHWYSSSGWVMWNLQVSALLLGTTICLYDGHPSLPQADTLWRFVSDTGTTFLGAGAAYYTGCMKNGVQPGALPGIRALRGLGSTGSPLPSDAYQWGASVVRDDVWWAVISGGTDLASAFLAGTPELPTVPGEMQGRALGADIQAWNEQGQPVVDDVGEMVCLQPMPSMPLMFWGDDGHRRYRDSYFDLFPGVWRHGDWLRITPTGGAVVYGRSDATLNRHGHRMGTSELYRVVEALPEVLDSLVVDIEYLGKPSYMPLFVALRDGVTLDDALRARIRQAIRDDLSPRFVPDDVLQVREIPRTLTGKKQELPVKKLLLGRALAEVVNKDACANPGAFDWFERFARDRQAGT